MHTSFAEWRSSEASHRQGLPSRVSQSATPKINHGFNSNFDLVYNYCRKKGYWKKDCPALKHKIKHLDISAHFKSAVLAVPVPFVGATMQLENKIKLKSVDPNVIL